MSNGQCVEAQVLNKHCGLWVAVSNSRERWMGRQIFLPHHWLQFCADISLDPERFKDTTRLDFEGLPGHGQFNGYGIDIQRSPEAADFTWRLYDRRRFEAPVLTFTQWEQYSFVEGVTEGDLGLSPRHRDIVLEWQASLVVARTAEIVPPVAA